MALPGMKPAWSATVLIVSAGALALYAWWPAAQSNTSSQPDAPSAGWQQVGVANPFGAGSPVAPSLATPPASPSQPPSLNDTSLAGTQADGDWGVDAHGQLRANRALRQRFDYYLSLTGEIPLSNIEALLLKEAKTSLKEPALGQMMRVWQNYLKLQQHAWQYAVDVKKPATWRAALSERQMVRRQLLGADWAYAFYLEEERELQNLLSQTDTPLQAAVPGAELPAMAQHPQASEREAALHMEWKLWDQRLQAAREQLGKLKVAHELSEIQRQQAMERYLNQEFQGAELLRAKALLGI